MTLPQSYKNKYERLLGDEAAAFFASFTQSTQKAYRVNPLKNQTQLYATPDNGQVPYGKWGHFGSVSGRSVDHTNGVVYSQEPSAQFVGEVVQPQPGEKVLDLSAAPGGKSTHLAAFMQQDGLLWTNEIFLNRAKILNENIERMGIYNSIVSSQKPEELSAKLPQFFDKILIDAPCSGEGMFRKDPDAISYWSESYPAECAQRQRDILAEAVKMLKPGGELVYSTCTFAPEEDEQMIAWLLSEYPDFSVVPIEKVNGIADGRPDWADSQYVSGISDHSQTTHMTELKGTARLWPHLLEGEGHFVAKLKLSTDTVTSDANVTTIQSSSLTAQQRDLLTAFIKDTLIDFELAEDRLILFGDHVYLAPIGAPSIKGMRILRVGLELGSFKTKRFEPAHALALALAPHQFQQYYEMNDAQWRQFVHGDVLNVEGDFKKGWVLMTMNGNGAGFGKYVNGQIKNFYPKGLRFAIK